MQIPIFQVDAFTDTVFGGNPAAVCPLNQWLDDAVLQRIAEENNLSETAFFVMGDGPISLRWFTPEAEVDLCGHATLAAAHVIFEHIGAERSVLSFTTRSGLLTVEIVKGQYCLDFPATHPVEIEPPAGLIEALGIDDAQVFNGPDYMVVVNSETQIQALTPNFTALAELDKRGVIVTAKGDTCDFVSRCFYPKLRINEDPVTGSAHCQMAPYWSSTLNKSRLVAKQLSKRQGVVTCDIVNDRVKLLGNATDYMQGQITLPSR